MDTQMAVLTVLQSVRHWARLRDQHWDQQKAQQWADRSGPRSAVRSVSSMVDPWVRYWEHYLARRWEFCSVSQMVLQSVRRWG